VVGGQDDDAKPVDDFLSQRVVKLCGWCSLEGQEIENEAELQRALKLAGARSMEWRWR
jgi:hypothetical protein